MYPEFIKNIDKKKLACKNDRILLAVSGGRDSMVMVHLFIEAGFDIAVAHFNHKTRNGESDRDENFVLNYCKDNQIPFFSTSEDIKARIKQGEGNNFQDLARKYRYSWLDKIRKENGYDLIATAHNRDDNIESFLYKLVKGSGSFGLGGINEKKGNIIRPMLDFSREAIDKYIEKNSIRYVEDSSNEKIIYDRNFIRHKIIPQFRELHPDFDKRISKTINNIIAENEMMNFLLEKYLEPFISKSRNTLKIDKNSVLEYANPEDLLYFYLFKYGFNHTQCCDIIRSAGTTGKIFLSDDHCLTIDRDHFNINPKNDTVEISIEIPGTGEYSLENGRLIIREIDKTEIQNFDDDKFYLCADAVSFPMRLRRWQAGDRFKPFGLKGGSQKIKKFLTGIKISPDRKKEVLVLESNRLICAVVPFEIDYDARITADCRKILAVELIR